MRPKKPAPEKPTTEGFRSVVYGCHWFRELATPAGDRWAAAIEAGDRAILEEQLPDLTTASATLAYLIHGWRDRQGS